MLVHFTELGWTFLRDAHHVKQELEAEYADVLGDDRLAQLRHILEALIAHEHHSQ